MNDRYDEMDASELEREVWRRGLSTEPPEGAEDEDPTEDYRACLRTMDEEYES